MLIFLTRSFVFLDSLPKDDAYSPRTPQSVWHMLIFALLMNKWILITYPLYLSQVQV